MQREHVIKSKLETLAPTVLEVINQSHLHQGHHGDDGTGESHFLIRIQSPHLNGKSRVEQHQIIYQTLDDVIKQGLHALAIQVIPSP